MTSYLFYLRKKRLQNSVQNPVIIIWQKITITRKFIGILVSVRKLLKIILFRRLRPQPELPVAGRDEQVPLRLDPAHGWTYQRLFARCQRHLPGESLIVFKLDVIQK